MWGQALLPFLIFFDLGIIPTRVGTRTAQGAVIATRKDHPHACGDKFVGAAMPPHILGSSPRVWGQDTEKIHNGGYPGIIPTRVGTSFVWFYSYFGGQDHPHACGDKTVQRIDYLMKAGSSPRVWGQGSIRAGNISITGIIPTRVGTSRDIKHICLTCKDHPHACGDKRIPLSPTC